LRLAFDLPILKERRTNEKGRKVVIPSITQRCPLHKAGTKKELEGE
jgi:hypothetical protein